MECSCAIICCRRPGSDPVEFAEQYYIHYPKIAPLMWPPLFHVTLGLSLLAGGPPGATALLLVALCCAWLVLRLHMIVERLAGSLAALVAVALLLTTPLVMTDGERRHARPRDRNVRARVGLLARALSQVQFVA
jgi:hypothetical protein